MMSLRCLLTFWLCFSAIVAQAQIKLPLEVIGADGYTKTVSFSLEDASEVNTLYLKAHRLAYRDASTNLERGAKGSVKLNNGAWINLDNSTVNCYEHEAAYGCLSGAYHTVRFTLPITGAKSGNNTLSFRFNATDNFSSGYRILELNLLKDTQPVLPESFFTQDDPTTWQPPRNTAADIQAGKQLWEKPNHLVDFPGGPPIQASCQGCHARDGRDLEYFAFSNWSIQERAKFHGLDQQEAEQIASYIRSLRQEKNIQPLGRPWNPPYQPGPGLDSKPVEHWAAGAGLEWVLEEDQDMIPYLFPQGTSPKAVREALATPINHRELPLSIQMPDWLAWLPEVHPVDALGEEAYYSKPERVLDNLSIHQMYERVHERYQADPTYWRSRDDLRRFIEGVHGVIGARYRPNTSSGSAIPDAERAKGEMQNRSVRHWASMKQWEIMQEYQLEDQGHENLGTGTTDAPIADRQWLTNARNVFELAPHRSSGINLTNLTFQDFLTGKYTSTAWYELQVILNNGVGSSQRTLAPVDWNYQPNHISNLYNQADGPAHSFRLVATNATLIHTFRNRTPQDNGWGTDQMHPARYAPVHVHQGQSIDQIADPALRTAIYDGLLANTLDLYEQFSPDDWQRRTGEEIDRRQGDQKIEPATYVPQMLEGHQINYRRFLGEWANVWYSMIPLFREAGVSEATLERVISWGESVWPLGDWEALRNPQPEDWTEELSFTDQMSSFATTFEVIPQCDNPDGVVGLTSDDKPTGDRDLTVVVRFNTNGEVDARNGDTFQADHIFSYSVGKIYQVQIDVRSDTKRYDVRVKEEKDSAWTALATDYAFESTFSESKPLSRLYKKTEVCGLIVSNAQADGEAVVLDVAEPLVEEVVVYPNPSTGIIHLLGVKGKVEAYNSLGHKVAETFVQEGGETLDLSGQSGIVFIRTENVNTKVLIW